nr:hypothetical protein [Tanacetum cinerariifolium]
MPNVDIPLGMDTCDSLKRQETMGGTLAQTRSERVLEQPNEPPLLEGHTSGSGEGRMEHTFELTDTIPPTPHDSPLTGAFITLTKRVKKLDIRLKQKRNRAVIHSSYEEEPSLDIEDSPKQRRMIGEIDKDENVNLVSEQAEVHDIAEPLKDDDASLVETLLNIKRSTAKDKGKGGYKQSYFKGMKYEDIRPIFERVWDQIHTFVPKDSEIKKEVKKRSGFHLQQESSKKQKLDEQTEDTDQEVEEMELYVKIVPDEDIEIDAIPVATKPLVIVEYKIVKEGKISTYHFIRANGSTKIYISMIKLLENIDREDFETL